MIDNFLSAVFGVAAFTKEKADELTNYLVEKGEMQRDEAKKLVEKLLEKGVTEKDTFVKKFQESVDAIKEKMVTKQDLKSLESKIAQLEKTIKKLEKD